MVNKFLSRRPTFLERSFTCAPNGPRIQKIGAYPIRAHPIETQQEILFLVLYNLNGSESFHFQCFSFKSFRKKAFVV